MLEEKTPKIEDQSQINIRIPKKYNHSIQPALTSVKYYPYSNHTKKALGSNIQTLIVISHTECTAKLLKRKTHYYRILKIGKEKHSR